MLYNYEVVLEKSNYELFFFIAVKNSNERNIILNYYLCIYSEVTYHFLPSLPFSVVSCLGLAINNNNNDDDDDHDFSKSREHVERFYWLIDKT